MRISELAVLMLCFTGCALGPTPNKEAFPMKVTKTEEKVWIDGIEGFSPGEYASSVHGAQARILQSLGEPLTYDDLICYSGFAFRVCVHEAMCPSAGHPCCGYNCLDSGLAALPWRLRFFGSFPWSEPKDNREAFENEVREAVKASIDRGIPVHYGSEEDGLIIGYGDEGRRWWCVHPYQKWGKEAFWYDEVKGFAGGKWPWAVVVWEEPKPENERVADRELTVAALKKAVSMWHAAEKHDEAYLSGEAAYTHWHEWLQGVESGKVENPKGGMQGNGWCFDVLIHSRRIAGKWLAAKADLFEGEAGAQIRAASDAYGRIPEVCMRDIECPWDLALPPNRVDEWTGEMRRDQIARLESAREHDRTAIRAIEKALETME